jgi:hypothetical protein
MQILQRDCRRLLYLTCSFIKGANFVVGLERSSLFSYFFAVSCYHSYITWKCWLNYWITWISITYSINFGKIITINYSLIRNCAFFQWEEKNEGPKPVSLDPKQAHYELLLSHSQYQQKEIIFALFRQTFITSQGVSNKNYMICYAAVLFYIKLHHVILPRLVSYCIFRYKYAV